MALFGAGVIGSGWATTYLMRSIPVRVADPSPEAEARMRAHIDSAWPSVLAMGTRAPAQPPYELLSFVGPADAGAGVDLVHENGPEDLGTKQSIYRSIEETAQPDVPILSSSGGLMPSRLQEEMRHPERFAVAHPLSPVHALALVEVLGGDRTATSTLDWAMAHFRALGKKPVRLHREVPAYLTNRLLFALVREAVHCLVEGVADAQGIEDAVVHGLAPRYITTGGLTSLALAGGPEGMAGAMRSYAEAIDGWWADLGTETMTAEVQRVLIDAADELMAGRTPAEIAADRDGKVVALSAMLRSLDDKD